MNAFAQVASRIIVEQSLVIGPLAWLEARKVPGLRIIDQKQGEVGIENGDAKGVIDTLVGQYDRLFGRSSHEVSREAALPLLKSLSISDIPSSLK